MSLESIMEENSEIKIVPQQPEQQPQQSKQPQQIVDDGAQNISPSDQGMAAESGFFNCVQVSGSQRLHRYRGSFWQGKVPDRPGPERRQLFYRSDGND